MAFGLLWIGWTLVLGSVLWMHRGPLGSGGSLAVALAQIGLLCAGLVTIGVGTVLVE
jgi:hypothetical protein